MAKLAWGRHPKVSSAMVAQIFKICEKFGWTKEQASHLLSCIAFETGQTFSPSIKNAAGSGAIGLIQFMPKTALALKTTTEELAQMDELRQLLYVELYFKPYAKDIKTLSDMYMAILMPKYIPYPDSVTVFSDGTTAYRQNSGLDKDRDGKVTKGEICSLIERVYEKGLQDHYALDV